VDLVPGNSGYHRAELLDCFIRHFGDWWLVGTNKAVTWGYEMDDLCEQWVAEGETGGLAAMVCFIVLISKGFGRIGKTRRRLSYDRKQEWLLWWIGVSLFSHCVGFFGISYFDQTRFLWFALFGIISAVTIPSLATTGITKRKIGLAQEETEVAELILLTVGATTSSLDSLRKQAHNWTFVEAESHRD